MGLIDQFGRILTILFHYRYSICKEDTLLLFLLKEDIEVESSRDRTLAFFISYVSSAQIMDTFYNLFLVIT